MKIVKLLILFSFVLSFGESSYSQTSQEVDLQKKYWNYRNRLKRDFSVVGKEKGKSVVMQRRMYGDGYLPFECGSYGWGGIVEWGDALSHHGTYLALLASEYKLLKNNNHSTDETLIELYYAIAALSRMDKNFDTYFSSQNAAVETGVLGRDDIYIGFENSWDFLVPNVPNIGPVILKSMGQSTHRNGDCTSETFRTENIWSKDHISSLLFGLCMIKKMVDNPYVKPQSSDAGFYIQDEIARIVNIWMTKFSDGHSWQRNHYAAICGDFTVTESINWTIVNDITNDLAPQHAGVKLGNVAWPFNEMAKYITGVDYQNGYFHTYDNPSVCPVGLEEFTTWAGLHTEWNAYYLSHVADYQDGLHLATDNETNYKQVINNLSTVFPIAAVSGLVDHQHLGNLTKYEDGTINPYALWELAYSQFRNENSIWTKSQVANVLALAPMCTNPANGVYNDQLEYWVSGNNAVHGLRPTNHNTWGYYSGMDYMLMYNLYRLQFAPNPNQEGGYSESSCECAKSNVVEIYDTGNDHFIWPAHALNVTSPLTTSHTVNAIATTYKNLRNNGNYLKLFEYMVTDLTVSGTGNLNIQTDYKITNEAELKIENGGIVTFSDPVDLPKTIYITSGSVVKVASNGTLEFGKNTVVVFQKGSVLDIEAGGSLVLRDNANLIIEHDAVIKCGDGIVNMSGANTKIVMRGLMRIKSAETFKPIGTGTIVWDNNTPQTATPTVDYNLVGDGLTSVVIFDNIKMQVLDYKFLYPSDLEHLEIENCEIKLGLNAYLNIGSIFTCTNNTFDRLDGQLGQTHFGLVVYGQDGMDPLDSRVTVENCEFKNGKFGIRAFQNFGGGKAISVLGNTFTNLGTALFVYDEGMYAFGNTFTECEYSIVTNHSTAYVTMESNKIAGIGDFGNTGTQIQGDGFRSVSAGNVFRDLGIGFGAYGGSHGFTCNSFVNNLWGITSVSNGSIIWSDEVKNGLLPSSSLSWMGSGYNLAYVSGILGTEHFLIEGSTRLFLRNGFNQFDLSAQLVFYTSGIVERSKNIVNGYLPIDIEYTNNTWVNYTQPPLPNILFENAMGNSFYKMNIGFYSINHGTLYPDIVGAPSNGLLVCPISDWGDAYDYDNFQPGQNSRRIYLKSASTGGLLDPYGTVTGVITGGLYAGQNYGDAINAALPDLTKEIDNSRFKVTSVSKLLDFGDLAKNVWVMEDHWDINEEILNDYIHFVISFLKQPTSTQSSKQLALSQLEAVINARELWLINTQQENIVFLNSQLVKGNLLKAQVYRVAKVYALALTELNDAYAWSSDITTPLINHYYCLIDNERMNYEGILSDIEFIQAVSACQGQLDSMRVKSREKTLAASNPVTNPSFSYVVAPNPVLNILNLSIEINEPIANLSIKVIDSYANEVYTNMLSDLMPGPLPYQIDLSVNGFGIYHVIISDGNTNVSKSFILN